MLLPRDFFARPSVEVAPDLLGCVLEHETPAGLVAVELTEVEAYAGRSDPASHAYRGKTARNAVMFGPPGHAYVYFTYGMHFCVNMVCLGEEGSASAVLLRAGAVIAGIGRFRDLLLSMSYEDPQVRTLLDLEGLKAWQPGRTSEYALLERACERFGTLDYWLAMR